MITHRPKLLDSRRLTGPNLLWDRPGATIDAQCAHEDAAALVESFCDEARGILRRVGLAAESATGRIHRHGVQLAVSAPFDVLYAACDVAELAFGRAAARIAADPVDEDHAGVEALHERVAAERKPWLRALRAAAGERGLSFLWDSGSATVGTGAGSRTFPIDDLPDPGSLDWPAIRDIPIAIVTGTNGKTTTVRIIAAALMLAGRTVGRSSTDGLSIGDSFVADGDYSGPEGARRVLGDRRTEVAVLEIARGGLLRRGLGVPRARVAAVLNVGDDHLGEFGVFDIETLARVKLLVSRAVPHGPLVLNADDPVLRRLGSTGRLDVATHAVPPRSLPPIRWFGRRAGGSPEPHVHVRGGTIVVRDGPRRRSLAAVADLPITLGGACSYNLDNALAATAVLHALGVTPERIAAGLRAFHSTPATNPGRTNLFELGGVRVIADFAHNPQAMRALFDLARALRPARTLCMLGQGGDRSDDAIRNLCRAVRAGRPDRILIKPLRHYLRGRPEGEMVELLEAGLIAAGTPVDRIARCDSELAAVRAALAWAAPGDLLLLTLHEERPAALQLLSAMATAGWRPGDPVPSP